MEGDLGVLNTPEWLADIAGGTTDATYASFAKALNDPRLTIPSVTNVLATNDVPYRIPWGLVRTDSKPGCPKTDTWHLSLTAHMKLIQPNDVSLEIALGPSPQEGLSESAKQVPNQCRVQTTVTVKDQQTIVLGGFAKARLGTEKSMLVVTPYIIWSDADLRTLFECKMRMAHATRPGA